MPFANLLKRWIRVVRQLMFRERIVYVTEGEQLKDKVIMVVGAGGGIGRPTSELLYKKGAHLIFIGRNKSKLEALVGFCGTKRSMMCVCDITSPQQCATAVSDALKKFGHVDALINCAGAFSFKALDDTRESEWDTLMDTNLKGIFHMCKAVIPHFKSRKQGCIINIGSKISHNTAVQGNRVLYATTKYAVEGFSNALHNELKPHHVRVCCLMPGTVYTYPTTQGYQYLSPYSIGEIVSCILTQEDVDFESVLFTSINQSVSP